MDQVIAEKPSALVLSGDITMNGEKINHEELARKLGKVQEAGIPVLVIPEIMISIILMQLSILEMKKLPQTVLHQKNFMIFIICMAMIRLSAGTVLL